MQEKREHRRKLNNKGLTLVEVIIAMIILTVTITALVSVMISSYRYNAMANARQHATLAAEAIMESFKGYDMETLSKQFENVDGMKYTGCALAADGGDSSAIGKTTAGADVALFSSGEFARPADDIYAFTLTKIQSEHAQYDAAVSVTPVTSLNKNLVGFQDIHPYKDAICRSSTAYEAKARQQIAQWFLDVKTDIATSISPDDPKLDYLSSDIVDDYNKILERKTIIKLKRDVSSGEVTATFNIKYYIAVENYEYYQTTTETVKSGKRSFPSTYVPGNPETGYCIDVILDIPTSGTTVTFYDNANEAGLERVFVYYYPVYVAQHADTVKDVIKFETEGFESGRTLECYLLKQLPSEAVMSKTTVGIKENGYSPVVEGTSMLKLIHNFNQNITGVGTTGGATTSGFASYGYMDERPTQSLQAKEYQLIYNVKVDIYEQGTTNLLATLQGTKMD